MSSEGVDPRGQIRWNKSELDPTNGSNNVILRLDTQLSFSIVAGL